MVVGLQRFRDHFRAHTGAFVLIGGAACDAWMTANALAFRRTKDLDIVLVADAVDAAFAQRFKAFVDAGGYEVRQRQETGKREFFRFYKPKGDDYPFMLELFSRARNPRLAQDFSASPANQVHRFAFDVAAIWARRSYWGIKKLWFSETSPPSKGDITASRNASSTQSATASPTRARSGVWA